MRIHTQSYTPYLIAIAWIQSPSHILVYLTSDTGREQSPESQLIDIYMLEVLALYHPDTRWVLTIQQSYR